MNDDLLPCLEIVIVADWKLQLILKCFVTQNNICPLLPMISFLTVSNEWLQSVLRCNIPPTAFAIIPSTEIAMEQKSPKVLATFILVHIQNYNNSVQLLSVSFQYVNRYLYIWHRLIFFSMMKFGFCMEIGNFLGSNFWTGHFVIPFRLSPKTTVSISSTKIWIDRFISLHDRWI